MTTIRTTNKNKKSSTKKKKENNVIDFAERRLRIFVDKLCKKHNTDENMIHTLVFKLLEHDITDFDDIEENVDAFMIAINSDANNKTN